MKRFLVPAMMMMALAGCGGGDSTAGGGGGSPAGGSGGAPAAEVMKVKAADMVKEFKADKAGATAKYKGKSVQVTGIVFDAAGGVHRECVKLEGMRDGKNLMVEAMGGEFPVEFLMSKDQMKAGTELTTGQEATLEGVCQGTYEMLGPVISLVDSKVVSKGTDPAVVVSAADLAKAFAEDAEGAKAKYDGKQVRVEGAISALNEKDFELWMNFGEGDKAVKIVFRLGVDGYDLVKNAKAGQVVKIQGKASLMTFDGKKISIADTTRVLEVK